MQLGTMQNDEYVHSLFIRYFTWQSETRSEKPMNRPGECCVSTVRASSYVSNPVSWPLVPTDELRLMTSRSTSFLSRTLQAGASSGMVLTPERKSQPRSY